MDVRAASRMRTWGYPQGDAGSNVASRLEAQQQRFCARMAVPLVVLNKQISRLRIKLEANCSVNRTAIVSDNSND